MRVFLTGGTGLLGSHVAERLRGSGMGVVALHRPGSDVRHLLELGCEVVPGDLGDELGGQVRRMEGCQGLVHAAAEVYGEGPQSRISEVNVEGTRRILGAAEEAGLIQAVHISSVAVYGNPPGPMSEETPLDFELPTPDFYARTKREAEGAAADYHGRHGLNVTILRPPLIYGERDRRFTSRIGRVLKGRRVVLMGRGTTRFAAVYAGNAAEAVEKALSGSGAGEAFNVTEDLGVTFKSLYEGLGRELGVRPYFVYIPAWLVRLGAEVGEKRGWEIPGAPGLSVSRAARLALENNPYPSRKAREILGWAPPHSLEEALTRTGQWLREKENRNAR